MQSRTAKAMSTGSPEADRLQKVKYGGAPEGISQTFRSHPLLIEKYVHFYITDAACNRFLVVSMNSKPNRASFICVMIRSLA